MGNTRQVSFNEFRLDLHDERLRRRGDNVPLGHKAFALLARLVSEPGQLVTKDELMASAWPDTAVTDAVLTTAMRELRLALGDDARSPRFIETVHGRGYRFIADVPTADAPAAPALVPDRLVGREQELERLHELLKAVQQGTRRVALIAGEAGIGKTTLVEAFISTVAPTLVAHGQCVEQYGSGEAYLPILEALGRLGRNTNVPLRDVLREHAPNWLAHLPALARDSGPQLAPVTPARMLRELADALESLTASEPLILVLEDLHWSDTATLEWLAYAARRRDPARLLVCATYRPLETLLHNHALRRLTPEMRRLPQCAELVLDYLSADAVRAYVAQRLGNSSGLSETADVVRRRTGGHPLFMSGIVDELVRSADSQPAGTTSIRNVVPAGVRQFIEYRFEQLSQGDRDILEAASVAGDPFYVVAVAASAGLPDATIESRCAAWEGAGQFVFSVEPVAWPDGTVTPRYRFRHSLYQEVLYASISPERRASLHSAAGERLERAYENQVSAIATELALHFEQGRQPERAVSYLLQAARNALERSAYAEGRAHLDRGEKLLPLLAQGPQRLRLELDMLLLLGRVLAATRGWAVNDVESVFNRARALAGELQDTRALLRALWGLIGVAFVGADFRTAQALGQQVLQLATTLRDPVYSVLGHMEIGGTAFHLGESAAVSSAHFDEANRLYNVQQQSSHIANFGVDMGVFSRSWESHFLWHKGRLAGACETSEEALAMARQSSHPLTMTVAFAYAAMLHQFRRDLRQVDAFAESTIRLCTEHGFPYYLAWAEVLHGWSVAASGSHEKGIAAMRRGIELLQAKAGARLPYYRALLAEGCLWDDRADEGLDAVTEALGEIERTGECWWDSELHRLRGELTQIRPTANAYGSEECFHRALSTARAQNAKPLELRAVLSLGRLWRTHGRASDAQALIQKACGLFGEGLEDPDLRDARTLLDELA